MSNRSLFEVNHDRYAEIEVYKDGFVLALLAYLRSGSEEDARALETFGLSFYGQRHHSEPRWVTWGAWINGERSA